MIPSRTWRRPPGCRGSGGLFIQPAGKALSPPSPAVWATTTTTPPSMVTLGDKVPEMPACCGTRDGSTTLAPVDMVVRAGAEEVLSLLGLVGFKQLPFSVEDVPHEVVGWGTTCGVSDGQQGCAEAEGTPPTLPKPTPKGKEQQAALQKVLMPLGRGCPTKDSGLDDLFKVFSNRKDPKAATITPRSPSRPLVAPARHRSDPVPVPVPAAVAADPAPPFPGEDAFPPGPVSIPSTTNPFHPRANRRHSPKPKATRGQRSQASLTRPAQQISPSFILPPHTSPQIRALLSSLALAVVTGSCSRLRKDGTNSLPAAGNSPRMGLLYLEGEATTPC